MLIGTPGPVPKPGKTKKKKKCNGYKNKASRECYYCGTYGAERHEVYQGAGNRQISIDMGFQVDLCPECHRAWHEQREQVWIDRKEEWQERYQRIYEDKLVNAGLTKKQARSIWMEWIGKNFTDEIM